MQTAPSLRPFKPRDAFEATRRVGIFRCRADHSHRFTARDGMRFWDLSPEDPCPVIGCRTGRSYLEYIDPNAN